MVIRFYPSGLCSLDTLAIKGLFPETVCLHLVLDRACNSHVTYVDSSRSLIACQNSSPECYSTIEAYMCLSELPVSAAYKRATLVVRPVATGCVSQPDLASGLPLRLFSIQQYS